MTVSPVCCPSSFPKAAGRGLTLSAEETPPVASPDSVRAPARGGVLASRLCPVCQKVPIHAGQEVCGRCRAARSRQRKVAARRERDAEIRVLLEAALQKLTEDP